MIADIHRIADNLVLIEGRHPSTLWEACDVPSIVVYRSATTLYLLDTGVGPEQRAVLLDLIDTMGAGADELVIVNSHGHYDHLGNNDLITAGTFTTRRHLITTDARPTDDIRTELRAMYGGGADYFNYFTGLPVTPDQLASLATALGADHPDPTAITRILTEADRAGLTGALGRFAPAVVVEILMATYPDVFPSLSTMSTFDPSPQRIERGGAQWTGWALNHGEVQVLNSGGHSAGGVVFYIPEHRFLHLADETTTVPIWPDTDPRRTVDTARRAQAMLAAGDISWLSAGHFPMLPESDIDKNHAALQRIIDQADDFTAAIDQVFTTTGRPLSVEDVYARLKIDQGPGTYVGFLIANQFPVFSTFMKLTILNHLKLHDYDTTFAPGSVPTFARITVGESTRSSVRS